MQNPVAWLVKAPNGMTRCILEREPLRVEFDLGEEFIPLYLDPPAAIPEHLGDKAIRVIEAAKFANFCPDAGGYREGRSMEDVYEELSASVNEYFGADIETPMTDWISEDELQSMLINP